MALDLLMDVTQWPNDKIIDWLNDLAQRGKFISWVHASPPCRSFSMMRHLPGRPPMKLDEIILGLKIVVETQFSLESPATGLLFELFDRLKLHPLRG